MLADTTKPLPYIEHRNDIFLDKDIRKNYLLETLQNVNDGKPEKMILDMITPEPEQTPLCSRIYICHNRNMENIECITLEKSVNDTECLCSWPSTKTHCNYGKAPATKEEVLEKVKEMYFGQAMDKQD